jgi:hypothetical protein
MINPAIDVSITRFDPTGLKDPYTMVSAFTLPDQLIDKFNTSSRFTKKKMVMQGTMGPPLKRRAIENAPKERPI